MDLDFLMAAEGHRQARLEGRNRGSEFFLRLRGIGRNVTERQLREEPLVHHTL